MAGVINYLYDPNQIVWMIMACGANNTDIKVKEGKVIRIRAEVLVTLTEAPLYDIQITGLAGTTEVAEADVFSSLALATAEYETRLT